MLLANILPNILPIMLYGTAIFILKTLYSNFHIKNTVQQFSYENESHFDMKISCAVIFHMNDGGSFHMDDGGSFHMKNTVYCLIYVYICIYIYVYISK
jgi:hypothetical protein